jgi:C-terminal processing protease CtpA/Prc
MKTTSLEVKRAFFDFTTALLLCLMTQSDAANQVSTAQPAQSQNLPQQTNGRGAIGVNCKPEGNGCRVGRIAKSGPAERAGLRAGDLLLRLNPSDSASATEQIAKNPPGTKITLPFQRGSEHMQVTITVEDQLAVALRGAALDDASAEETLGSIYRSGVGVPKNPAEALK